MSKAIGDVQVIAVLDGYWPDPPLPDDPRVVVVHHGHALGMRPAINHAAQIATGEYLLKCDAHTMWDHGFDEKLKADYQSDDWILIPRRYALDPEKWAIDPSNRKYPIDYHSLAEPFAKYGDSTPGLHGTAWTARREARKDVMLDDELTSQGSAWFMSRAHWNHLAPLDNAAYGVFWHEFQELGLKTWLSSGAVKVTKNTWYAHLYKGKRYGRGYSTSGMGHEDGTAFCSWFWMTDQPFTGRTRTMRSLIEQFSPVPTWPEDLDAVFARAQRELRNPYAAAA